MSSMGKHRQHAVAHQLQHLAAGIVDRVDRGLGVIVEERDDLVGRDGLADRGRAAQIREPQYGVDALGDAARDFSAQHLLGGVAAEIDPAERSRDIGVRGGLDRKPQHRHQVAQRRKALLAKTIIPPRHPVGIEAIHLPHGAGLAEAVHEGDEMLVTLGGEIVDHREIELVAIGEIDPDLVMAVLEQMMEGRAAPGLGGIALIGRAIFEHFALVALGVVPAKAAALEDRMQRVDEDDAARQIEPAGAAALAEAAQQVVFRQSGQTLADQPVHQMRSGRRIHHHTMPRNHAWRKACRMMRRAA